MSENNEALNSRPRVPGTLDVGLGRIANQTITLAQYRGGESVIKDWEPDGALKGVSTNPRWSGVTVVDGEDPHFYGGRIERHSRGT